MWISGLICGYKHAYGMGPGGYWEVMAAKLLTATAQGAIEYLDSLVTKNRAPAPVVSPLKTALTKVLQCTEGEGWGRTVLIDLDVSDTMMRFRTLTPVQYTPGSYRNYEMRLKKAIEWYLKFLQTPGWVPSDSTRSAATNREQSIQLKAETVRNEEVSSPTDENVERLEVDADIVTYPFPLESGKMATLQIPKDITADDAERLHSFLDALVIRKEGSGETYR